jgi:hypothetical protein
MCRRARHLRSQVFSGLCVHLGKPYRNTPYPAHRPPGKSGNSSSRVRAVPTTGRASPARAMHRVGDTRLAWVIASSSGQRWHARVRPRDLARVRAAHEGSVTGETATCQGVGSQEKKARRGASRIKITTKGGWRNVQNHRGGDSVRKQIIIWCNSCQPPREIFLHFPLSRNLPALPRWAVAHLRAHLGGN